MTNKIPLPDVAEISAGKSPSQAPEENIKFDRSNELFDSASQIIPLASQTFSKSHQQWPRGCAPLFLNKGKGAHVCDIDGNRYIDYLQGLMANILGYGDEDVDAAIKAQLDNGISFSLPSPLESELAETLIELIPCAQMVRFGKNGSDATTAAIRIARAATGRTHVAVCGYHGWHDWYIGTTTRSLGVPPTVSELSTSFPFNDLDIVEDTFRQHPDKFAALILEPSGNQVPRPGYLASLRQITEKYGVILVFDEIVTGFRIHIGGAQAHYGVTPDLACFGKALGNGMPISALVGRRDLMSRVEDIFYSCTAGGETLSIAAAIATIAKIKKSDAISRMSRTGGELQIACNAILAQEGLSEIMSYMGEAWWPRLTIKSEPPVDPVLLTTLLRQEFLAQGLLLASGLNLCLPHDDEDVKKQTLTAFASAMSLVKSHINSPDPHSHLRGALIKPTFSVRGNSG